LISSEPQVYQMFHYRQTPLNSRTRMLIAVFLATVIHIGIMNFEVGVKPILAPSVSLPRSVSVFLGQKKEVKTPEPQIIKKQIADRANEKKTGAKTEPEKPVVQEKSVVREIMVDPIQEPVLPKKIVREPVVEKILPELQGAESTNKELMPDPGEVAQTQESVTQAEPLTVQEEGVSLPGTVQLAYPRYQLNTPPSYPGVARRRGQEGTVFLQVLVNGEGGVEDLEIETSSGFALLDRAAVSSVKKWSFEPGRQNEKRIAMWVRVPVTFKLKK